MPKRRFSTPRRPNDESTTAVGESAAESLNGAPSGAIAPPEPKPERTKRTSNHEWQVDDDSGLDDEPDALVPASEPESAEARQPETDGHEPAEPPQPEAPLPAAAPDDSISALEEQARSGAAQWLRDQVRQIERSADERVEAAVKAADADREKAAAERREEPAPQAAGVAQADLERIRAEAEERTRLEVEAARTAAQERYAAELRMREQELEAEREERRRIMESSDRRLRDIENSASAAAERIATAERELEDEAARLRADAERRVTEEAARARADATEAVDARVADREDELNRERATIEGELAATRRQLEEAERRAAEAEGRATEIEAEARREIERERESRFQAIENKIGEVAEQAGGAARRIRDGTVPAAAAESEEAEIAPPAWVMETPAQKPGREAPAVEPDPTPAEPEAEPDSDPQPETRASTSSSTSPGFPSPSGPA